MSTSFRCQLLRFSILHRLCRCLYYLSYLEEAPRLKPHGIYVTELRYEQSNPNRFFVNTVTCA